MTQFYLLTQRQNEEISDAAENYKSALTNMQHKCQLNQYLLLTNGYNHYTVYYSATIFQLPTCCPLC